MLKVKQLHKDEQGVVSLVVTTMVIIIISLVVVSFARIVQRDQHQSIDRQLSTQAFYAAETGVNDAVKALASGYNTDKTSCGPDSSGSLSVTNSLDSSSGISYTCLLIDQTPPTLEFSTIGLTQTESVPLHTTAAIDHILISWQDAGGGKTFASSIPSLSPSGSWTSNTGVLRLALVPANGVLSRNGLSASSFTAFLYPQAGSGLPTHTSYSTDVTQQGAIISGNCSTSATPRLCNVQIDGLSGLNSNNFVMQMRSIYSNSTVTVSVFSVDGTRLDLHDAQAMVDSTGKANDVLRRIQVRIPTHSSYNYPDFAIESSFSVCKRFGTLPPISGSAQTTVIEATPDPSGCVY